MVARQVFLISAVLVFFSLIFIFGNFVSASTQNYACNDGIDNDGDGMIDYPHDPGCYGSNDNSELSTYIECDDGIDNDGDGYVDFPYDAGCSSLLDDNEYNAPPQRPKCSDGIDNDGDGFADYPCDPGCYGLDDDSELDPDVHCDDGIDNDYDGFIDYPQDSGCLSPTDNNERTACQDIIDNDGDGLVDLRDPGCYGVQDTSELNPSIECDDGIDNDGDWLVDYPEDPGCSSLYDNDEYDEPPKKYECDDGLDNDGDGFIDHPDDPGCYYQEDNSELNPAVDCDDGVDNDGDGFVDYPQDPGCSSPIDDDEYDAPPIIYECEDGIDNDDDGLVDYPADPGCSDPQDDDEYDAPLVQYACNDGEDNDNDGYIDYPDDVGCSGPSDISERTQCQDGIDNDVDNYVDMNDPGCYGVQDTSELNPNRECDDGIDNDNDGDVDYPEDNGCSSPSDNDEGGEDEEDDEPIADASASPTRGDEPLKVRFTGDVDGGDSPFTYRWDFDDGRTSSKKNPTHTYRDPGTYYATFRVTDDDGDTDTDTVKIRVYDDDYYDDYDYLDVDARASITSGDSPLRVRFYGDAEGGDTPYDYSWTFGDGWASSSENAVHTYTRPGTYTATLRVTDDDGYTGTDTVTIRVYGREDDYPRAHASASPRAGDTPLQVTFGGYATEGDWPFRYYWVFGDGSTSADQNPIHTYDRPGTYTVVFRVTDDDGDTDTQTIIINVNDGYDDDRPQPPADGEETHVSVIPGFFNTLSYEPVTGSIRIHSADADNFRVRIRGVPEDWLDFKEKNVQVTGDETVYYIVRPTEEGKHTIIIDVESSSEEFDFIVPLWVGRKGKVKTDSDETPGGLGPEETGGLTGMFVVGDYEVSLFVTLVIVMAAIATVVLGHKLHREKEEWFI